MIGKESEKMYNPTENDDMNNKILEMALARIPQTKIAEALGVSQDTVSKRIRAMRLEGAKIPSAYKTQKDYETDQYILKRLGQDINQTQIAKELGITQQAVALRIKNMRYRGIHIPGDPAEPHSIEKSTNELILRRKGSGKTNTSIAQEIGVHVSTVSCIIDNMKKAGIDPSKSKKAKKNLSNEAINNLILASLSEDPNKSHEQVAEETGLTLRQIRRRIEKMRENGKIIPGRTRVTPTILRQLANGDEPSTSLTKEELKKRIARMAENNPQTLAKTLRKLMADKKATPEQIKALGECYGFDAESILNPKEIEID